jgi:predicted alpha/beta hydrolase family esterase
MLLDIAEAMLVARPADMPEQHAVTPVALVLHAAGMPAVAHAADSPAQHAAAVVATAVADIGNAWHFPRSALELPRKALLTSSGGPFYFPRLSCPITIESKS